MNIVLDWLKANSGKIILVVVVTVVAVIATRVTSRLLNKVLRRAQIPNASIFVNLARVLIWTLAVTLILRPVFGINPVTVFTALGIGGFAVSLGLKDSIANTIGGFQLMFSHVLQPGDVVSISGVTGTVTDVTWRQTIVRERNGNTLMIPNSVLNTTALEKYLPSNEAQVTIPFTAKPGVAMDALTTELLGQINESAHDLGHGRDRARRELIIDVHRPRRIRFGRRERRRELRAPPRVSHIPHSSALRPPSSMYRCAVVRAQLTKVINNVPRTPRHRNTMTPALP